MKNKGFVLLSVIFAVTLLFTAAVAFARFASVQLRRASTEDFTFRTRCAAKEACAFAVRKISEDKNDYDSVSEPLYSPRGGISLELGGFKIDVKIKPLNDRIALQGIFLPDGSTLRTEYEQAWKNIWDEVERPDLAQPVLDFMDADEEQRLGSREEKTFLNRIPYDLSELKLMKGIDDKLLYGNGKKKALSLFISADGSDKINVNLASAGTLAVLDTSIGWQNAQSFVIARNAVPVENISDLKKYPGFSAAVLTKLSNVLSVESTQFELLIRVTEEKRERKYKAIVQRGEGSSLIRWEE